MDTANMMRVNARSNGYSGNSSTPHDKQQQHRQKVQALFEAIGSGNLDASRHAFRALVNFDSATLNDPQFLRISKFLDASSIYLAQQVVKEIKASWLNAQASKSAITRAAPGRFACRGFAGLIPIVTISSNFVPACLGKTP